MKKRLIGRIILGVLAVVFAALAISHLLNVSSENAYEGFRATAYAILALASITAYRYVEL
ncbi:MAG: hypothetical protein ACLFWL_03360 [Candidatus Brocadiia bacterium]|nr:hypothetical protein [Planctomycetota bacterium]